LKGLVRALRAWIKMKEVEADSKRPKKKEIPRKKECKSSGPKGLGQQESAEKRKGKG